MKFKFAFAALVCVAFAEAANAGLQVRVGNGQGVRVNAGFNNGLVNRSFIGLNNFNRGIGFNNFNRGYGFNNFNRGVVLLAPSYGYGASFGQSYGYSSAAFAQSYVQPSSTVIVREVPVYVQSQQTLVQPQAAAEVYCPPTETLAAIPQAAASVQVYQAPPVGFLPIQTYQPGAIFVPGRGWHHHPGHHPHPTPTPTPTPGAGVRR